MQILAIEKELKPLHGGAAREILRDEAKCVWALKKKGVIREIWFTCRGKVAVVMLECESEEEARRVLSSLPLVREQYIEFEVRGLRAYDGFDRLLAAEEKAPDSEG